MATTSSLVLSAILETGSGVGVTAALIAVFDPWETIAMPAPATAARSCISGDSCSLARYASSAATGTRTNVCSAFQIMSKPGTLSAKNSITNIAPLTHQLFRMSRPAGNAIQCTWARSPSVSTVAYTFNPAAKLAAIIRAAMVVGVNDMTYLSAEQLAGYFCPFTTTHPLSAPRCVEQ